MPTTPETPQTPSTSTLASLPLQAQDFLNSRLADQQTQLASLRQEHASLEAEHEKLKKANPSLKTTIDPMEYGAFARAVEAKDVAGLEQFGKDFDARFGEGFMVAWFRDIVLGGLRKDREEIMQMRMMIFQFGVRCGQYYSVAAGGGEEGRD